MKTPISIFAGSLIISLGAYLGASQGLSHATIDKHTDARTYKIDHTDKVEVYGAGFGDSSSYDSMRGGNFDMTGAVTIQSAAKVEYGGDVTVGSTTKN